MFQEWLFHVMISIVWFLIENYALETINRDAVTVYVVYVIALRNIMCRLLQEIGAHTCHTLVQLNKSGFLPSSDESIEIRYWRSEMTCFYLLVVY